MIPVRFKYNDMIYDGYLQSVSGSGGNVYHLMINKFYFGRLRKVQDKWVLDTNKKSQGMEVMAEGLGAFADSSKR